MPLIREQAHATGIEVKEESAHDIEIHGSPDDIKRAFLNILLNAVDAVTTLSDRPPMITVRTEQEDDRFRVLISDNGAGMDDDDKARVFTPYFTTKTKGTGLGLYIAQRIIKDHGGTITIESRKEHGTTFINEFT